MSITGVENQFGWNLVNSSMIEPLATLSPPCQRINDESVDGSIYPCTKNGLSGVSTTPRERHVGPC